jgi:putative hemolysin
MIYVLGIIILLLFSAFFSASEIAYSSINKVRLESMIKSGSKRAEVAYDIYNNFDKALSAILIGNNLVNIAASSLATYLAITLIGEHATSLAALLMTVLVLIFGEISPKIFASRNSLNFALMAAYPLKLIIHAFSPLIALVKPIISLVKSRFKGETVDKAIHAEAVEEELVTLLDTVESEGLIDENRRNILSSALDFTERSVSDVLTARVDMYAIDLDDDREDILKKIQVSPYSRIPFYEDSIDNIVGILYLNHFYRRILDDPDLDIRSLLMPPVFLYKTAKLPNALEELRKSQTHLGIVTDDYGGSMGLITIEDIMETLVGEIWDENDEVYEEILQQDEHTYIIDGDVSIHELISLLDWDEDQFEYESDTVGGWCIEMIEGYPQPGDHFAYENILVTVLAMDNLRVDRIRVQVVKGEDEQEDSNA